MSWEVIEVPNGFPERRSIAHTPAEVALLLRLPWSQGYYFVNRITEEPCT